MNTELIKKAYEQYGEPIRLTPEEVEADCGVDDEWMPEVGKECEYSHSGLVYHKCLVMGFFEDLIWLNHHNYDNDGLFSGSPITHDISSLSFRPLKTEREKLFDQCVDVVRSKSECNIVNADHKDAIECLIDAGIIKGDSK